jgi:hypothetical protein
MDESQEQLQERIAAYLDGQLSPAEAARFEVYIANTDPALASQILGMASDKHSVRSLPKVRAPQDLAARVMEQVERTTLLRDQESWESPRRPWFKSGWALAAAVALVIGGITFVVNESISATRRSENWQSVARQSENKGEPPGQKAAGAAGAATAATPGAVASASGNGAKITGAALSKAGGDAMEGNEVARVKDGAETLPTMSMANSGRAVAPIPASTASAFSGRTPTEAEAGRAMFSKSGAEATDTPGTLKTAEPVASAEEGIAQLAAARKAGQPLILTLAARDEGDLSRLRERLAEWSAAQGGTADQAANSTVQGAATTSAGNANLSNNVQRQQQQRVNNYQQQMPQNIDQRARNNYEPSNSIVGGAVTGTLQNGSNGSSTNPFNPADFANEKSLKANADDAGKNYGNVLTPTTYRVTLRPDQLEALVREFRVSGLVQGDKQLVVDASRALRNGAETTAGETGQMNPGIVQANRPVDGIEQRAGAPAAKSAAPEGAAANAAAANGPDADARDAVRGTAIAGNAGGGSGFGGGLGGGGGGGGRGGRGGAGGAGGGFRGARGGGRGGFAPNAAPAAQPEADTKADASAIPTTQPAQVAQTNDTLRAATPAPVTPSPAAPAAPTIDCLIQITPPPAP